MTAAQERAARVSGRRAALSAWLDAVPGGTWVRCPGCAVAQHRDRLYGRAAGVCHRCAHHFRLDAGRRLATLLDDDSFVEIDADLLPVDALEFVDTVAYGERLRAKTAQTGLREAAISGTATVAGHAVVVCVLDFAFQGGSMGAVVGEKVTRAAERALADRTPLVVCSSSGGARMQEGIFSLMQMAKTAAAVRRLSDAGVPFVSILADPVYGGVAASFAALGDVIVAEPGARAGFAGPQVISQTIRQELPRGFQTAEFLLEHGHIDAVVSRRDLRSFLARLLGMHGLVGEAGELGEIAAPQQRADGASARPLGAWETVKLARNPQRPHLDDYLQLAFDDFLELRGDRAGQDDPAILCGLARLAGAPVVVIGHRKGATTQECVARNFAMAGPAGYRKAIRLMRYAERFGLPLVTFIDTPGAYPGIDAERHNQSGAIAECLAVLAGLRVPVISVLAGEGGSGGGLALGVCDRLIALSNSIYSVISPEGCATILFGDTERAPQAAERLRLTAADMLRFGVADEVVAEPGDGAHSDHPATAAAVAAAVRRQLADVLRVPTAQLVDRRYARIRCHGHFTTAAPVLDDVLVSSPTRRATRERQPTR